MKNLANKILALKADFEKAGQTPLFTNIVAALGSQNKEAAKILNPLFTSQLAQPNKVVSSTAKFIDPNPNPHKEHEQQGCDGCGSNSTATAAKKANTPALKIIKSNIQPLVEGEEKLIDVNDPELGLDVQVEAEEEATSSLTVTEQPKPLIGIKITSKEIKERYKTLDEMKDAASMVGVKFNDKVTYLKLAGLLADAINLA